jgi:hypothetical protein
MFGNVIHQDRCFAMPLGRPSALWDEIEHCKRSEPSFIKSSASRKISQISSRSRSRMVNRSFVIE